MPRYVSSVSSLVIKGKSKKLTPIVLEQLSIKIKIHIVVDACNNPVCIEVADGKLNDF